MAAMTNSKKKAAKRPAKKAAKKKAAKNRTTSKRATSRGGKPRGAKGAPPAGNMQLPFEGDDTQADMHYPAGTIADMLGITDRHLRRLATEGIVPKATRGRYPMRGCVRSYILHLQKTQATADHRSKEHTRLNSARADTYELELNLKRGELYSREDVDSTLFNVCTIFTAMLDGSASRIASQLGGGATLRTKLVDEFRVIREQVASGLRGLSNSIAESGGDSGSTTRRKPRRVVKKKGTTKRKR